MKIGNIDLGDRPLLLAPMEDVTDASFRFICKEFGADMMYTEFISSDGLIRDARKSLEKLVTYDYETPIGIQIYGNIPEAMVDAAVMAEKAAEIAGGHGADLVDINFGCPVNKIARRGAGSGMMREPDKMVEITRRVVDAVKLPVTVKTRLGWDEDSKTIVELAERLQDAGIRALTVHGRTRCQMYTGEADWTLIGKVKENPRMHIPIIGNGDITSPQKAKDAFDRYGVDGIMIGRATYGHPWIFKEIRHYLDTGEQLPQMSVRDRSALPRDIWQNRWKSKGSVSAYSRCAAICHAISKDFRTSRRQGSGSSPSTTRRNCSAHLTALRNAGEVKMLPKPQMYMDFDSTRTLMPGPCLS